MHKCVHERGMEQDKENDIIGIQVHCVTPWYKLVDSCRHGLVVCEVRMLQRALGFKESEKVLLPAKLSLPEIRFAES